MKAEFKETEVFLSLLRAGLWEREARLLQFNAIDYSRVLSFAEEQSVVGIIAAGLEHVTDLNVPKEDLLQFVGQTLQIEQQNKDMNTFIARLIEKLRKADIYALLVKGQGIAQCYEKPLWRTSGDIDLFLSADNFGKAIQFLTPLSSENNQDSRYTKSYGLIIKNWTVELHGTLRSGLSTRLDNEIDAVQKAVFFGGDARSWQNGNTVVFLPGIDSDLFFLFTHFVRHFYHHEFMIRQTCDWCRFLWTHKGNVDVRLLETRLKNTHLMGEWKAFAAFAVNYLGMPMEAMPLYDSSSRWNKKAEKILGFAIYYSRPNKVKDSIIIGRIFPCNTFRFLPSLLFNVNGKKIKERLLLYAKSN